MCLKLRLRVAVVLKTLQGYHKNCLPVYKCLFVLSRYVGTLLNRRLVLNYKWKQFASRQYKMGTVQKLRIDLIFFSQGLFVIYNNFLWVCKKFSLYIKK